MIPQHMSVACRHTSQFYLYGIADESSRERIDIIEHAFPFYIIPDSEPVFDMSLYMIRNDTDY